MTPEQEEAISRVIVALLEAVGGADVADEALVAPIQAEWYRTQVKILQDALT